jgi:hypothetical protein
MDDLNKFLAAIRRTVKNTPALLADDTPGEWVGRLERAAERLRGDSADMEAAVAAGCSAFLAYKATKGVTDA